MRPSILALDLEGTLISNAVSQIPRPGLYEFLQYAQGQFDQLVMFTTVDEMRFRRIAALLVSEGKAPDWFVQLAYTTWSGRTKDLTFVSPTLGEALLFDDHAAYVHPGQEVLWVEVPLFGSPYLAEDEGLLIAKRCLEERIEALASGSLPPCRREGMKS
ncbi:NIF family HAD-type phosphatase [Stenotrophomonas maltophilia]|uniref:NIF family HAD-type phosphatase n=1 Tax=Stenotrophomonas maltophilia TaxID=40324 RepID=UPI00115F1C34|nr:NIF family HAD-type phosphatase [Stenotrophomonas maltophilia]